MNMNRRTWMRMLASTPLAAGPAAAATAIHFKATSRGTYEIAWRGGNIELNLVPMSLAAAETAGQKVAYTKMRDDASLYLPIADLVGVTAMRLDGAPPVPRI